MHFRQYEASFKKKKVVRIAFFAPRRPSFSFSLDRDRQNRVFSQRRPKKEISSFAFKVFFS